MRDVLRLQADPPARELEKFFTLGTEIPRLRRDDKFESMCSACLRKASAKASGQVLLLKIPAKQGIIAESETKIGTGLLER